MNLHEPAISPAPDEVHLGGGRYQLLEPVGIGGLATVYRAIDRTLQCQRAVKVLHPFAALDDAALQRFLAEGRVMAGLDHPHVVQATDMGSEDGEHWIAMEFMRGGSAAERLVKDGPFTVDEALRVTFETLTALAAAHSSGVVHRDVRPANLLLTAAGTVKVSDFGIARLRLDGELTTAGKCLGMHGYAPPEQLLDASTADVAADLYAVGATLYNLLTGRVPPALDRDGFDPRDLEVMPYGIMGVLERAMCERPDDRFADAREMAEALAEARDALDGFVRGALWLDRFDRLLDAHKAR